MLQEIKFSLPRFTGFASDLSKPQIWVLSTIASHFMCFLTTIFKNAIPKRESRSFYPETTWGSWDGVTELSLEGWLKKTFFFWKPTMCRYFSYIISYHFPSHMYHITFHRTFLQNRCYHLHFIDEQLRFRKVMKLAQDFSKLQWNLNSGLMWNPTLSSVLVRKRGAV